METNRISITSSDFPAWFELQDSRRKQVACGFSGIDKDLRCGAYWLRMDRGRERSAVRLSVLPGEMTEIHIEPQRGSSATPLPLYFRDEAEIATYYERWNEEQSSSCNLKIFSRSLDESCGAPEKVNLHNFKEFERIFSSNREDSLGNPHIFISSTCKVSKSTCISASLAEGHYVISSSTEESSFYVGLPIVSGWETQLFCFHKSNINLKGALVLLAPMGLGYQRKSQRSYLLMELMFAQMARRDFTLALIAFEELERIGSVNPVAQIAALLALLRARPQGYIDKSNAILRSIPDALFSLPDINIIKSCLNGGASLKMRNPPIFSESWMLATEMASTRQYLFPRHSVLNHLIPLQVPAMWFCPLLRDRSYIRSRVKRILSIRIPELISKYLKKNVASEEGSGRELVALDITMLPKPDREGLLRELSLDCSLPLQIVCEILDSPESDRLCATGRRKRAMARVRGKSGNGQIVVNGRPFEEYFTTLDQQNTALAPLIQTTGINRYDWEISSCGGGLMGQAGAVSLAFARALDQTDEANRPILKPLKLLKRDPREKERKKPGRAGARKRFQYSKR